MPSKKAKLSAGEELHRMREEGKRKDKEIGMFPLLQVK
jgi:hypothetical protein